MSSPCVVQPIPTHSIAEQPQTVWLDKLPPDVLLRIASNLVARGDSSCALNLSKVSISQQTAVKQSFSYAIDFCRLSHIVEDESSLPLLQKALCALLSEDVRAIGLMKCPYEFFDLLKACFKSPALVKVHVSFPDRIQDDLDTLLYATNLRSLTLHVLSDFGEVMSVLTHMSALDIRQLELCAHECLHNYLTNDPSNHAFLAACFPRVQKLKLACCSCRHWNPPSFLWHAMEPFGALTELTIEERVPEHAIEKLKHINCINLHGKSHLQLVDKLPTRVVEIKITLPSYPQGNWSFFVPSLSSGQLEKFAMCTRLEILECRIQRGTERALLQSVSNLRHLMLSVSDHDQELYQPEIGSIVNIVKAAPFLKKLQLGNMMVQRGELREILIVLGARLEHFEEGLMCYPYIPKSNFESCSTEKKQLEEIIATVRTAALHNPSLQVFSVFVEDEWFKKKEVVQSVLPKLEKSLDLLQRRAPLLVMNLWKILLHGLQSYCVAEEMDFDKYFGDSYIFVDFKPFCFEDSWKCPELL